MKISRKNLWMGVGLLVFGGITQHAAAQADTLRFLTYNILQFSGNSTDRVDSLEYIIDYIQPDLWAAQEISGSGGNSLVMSGALDDLNNNWAAAPYVDGPDLDVQLYYRDSEFGFVEANTISTNLRNIRHYRLYVQDTLLAARPDTLFFDVFVMHLKASQGTSNENQRNGEINNLRSYLTSNSLSENLFVMGDFNVYTSSEPAYQNLLTGTPAFFDPINRPGNWHTNSSFADIHTQSPRNTQFGGGAPGGLDDRFDFILTSGDVQNGNSRLQYIPNTYTVEGNDGNHYNLAITDPPTNTSGPARLIQALHDMTDHLPVHLEVAYSIPDEPVAVAEAQPRLRARFYQPAAGQLAVRFTDAQPQPLSLRVLDLQGRELLVQPVNNQLAAGTVLLDLPELPGGVYLLTLTDGTARAHTRLMLR